MDARSDEIRAHIEAHIERTIGRAMLKLGIAGVFSACATLVGVTWTVTHYFDRVDRSIELQQKQIDTLEKKTDREDAHAKAIEDLAILAKGTADNATSWIAGHTAANASRRP